MDRNCELVNRFCSRLLAVNSHRWLFSILPCPASPHPHRRGDFSYSPGTVSCVGLPTELHFPVNLPPLSPREPFPGAALCSSQQNGHWVEGALGVPYHFLGLFQMHSSPPFSDIVVSSRVGLGWFLGPCLTGQSTPRGFHCMRLKHLGSSQAIPLSPLGNSTWSYTQ